MVASQESKRQCSGEESCSASMAISCRWLLISVFMYLSGSSVYRCHWLTSKLYNIGRLAVSVAVSFLMKLAMYPFRLLGTTQTDRQWNIDFTDIEFGPTHPLLGRSTELYSSCHCTLPRLRPPGRSPPAFATPRTRATWCAASWAGWSWSATCSSPGISRSQPIKPTNQNKNRNISQTWSCSLYFGISYRKIACKIDEGSSDI